MTKPFFFRLEPAQLLSELIQVQESERGRWITQLLIDLTSGTPTTTIASKLMEEAANYSEIKRTAAKKRWDAKQCKSMHVHADAMQKDAPPMQSNASNRSSNSNKEIHKQIIADLNTKGGYRYTANDTTVSLINARMKEGATFEDFCTVHSNMIAKWKDDESMAQYIRPSTLYQATKFQGYLNAIVKPKQPVLEEWR